MVNISGAFLIGLMVEVLEPRFEDSTWVRTAILTGFLGAYTTFSTLSLDTYRLLDEGHLVSACELGRLAGARARRGVARAQGRPRRVAGGA